MDGSPEPSQTTKSNDGDHKESRAPSSRLQDTQGRVAECVTSYSSPSSVGLSSSVPGPMATHSKTSKPHKDSSVDHLPLPLPPAEPYEAYLCRVGCSSWPSSDSRPDSVLVNAVDRPHPGRTPLPGLCFGFTLPFRGLSPDMMDHLRKAKNSARHLRRLGLGCLYPGTDTLMLRRPGFGLGGMQR